MKKLALVLFLGALITCGKAYAASNPENKIIASPENGKKSHPYLFFNKEDIPGMRRAAATTHKKYFDDLKKWGDRYIGFNPLPAGQLPDNIDIMQVYCENSMSYIFNMSLLYQLSGDQTYLKAARKWILEFATYPYEIKGNFCVGAYAIAFASGYDILYNELGPSERARLSTLLAAVVERGKKGTISDWWAGISLNHDHWLPVTGLAVGAAALYYENENAPGWLNYFLDIFKTDMGIVGDDGAWTEGTANWVYAMSLPYVFCDVYKRLTGINMFQLPMIRNGMYYRLYSWLPDNSYVYHHDSFVNGRYNVLGAVSSHILHKLATENKDGHIQWLALQDEILDLKDLNEDKPVKSDWELSKNSMVPYIHCLGWNFLWYDPKIKPETPDNLPLYHYFPNQGLVNIRSGWKNSDVVFSFTCAPVGGHNAFKAVAEGNKKILSNFGHSHAQANAFDIYAYGTYLAVPTSYGPIDSKFHSTLTIEGADQQRSPKFEASITKAEFKKDYSYIIGDAAKCYPSDINLESWCRHIAYLKPNVFIIADILKANQTASNNKSTIWHLDYNPEITKATIDSANQTITIAGKSVLKADLLYPSDLKFEEKKVGWSARQVNALVTNIFASKKDNQFLAVLSALENNQTKAPLTRLIKSENSIGAVVDNGNLSSAAVFCLDNNSGDFELAAQAKTTFYLFSYLPNSSYDISVSSKPKDNGLFVYTVSVKKGSKFSTNSDGTMVLLLDKSKNPTLRPIKE